VGLTAGENETANSIYRSLLWSGLLPRWYGDEWKGKGDVTECEGIKILAD